MRNTGIRSSSFLKQFENRTKCKTILFGQFDLINFPIKCSKTYELFLS